ncbi:MAG: SPOR domain-containing protein [Acidobacteria bacterium]|nr:SPOR domain-containing protein [Acidobacteriota bacterium]
MKMPKISLLKVISLFCLATAIWFNSSANGLTQNRSAYSVQIASSTSEADALSIIVEMKAKGVDAYLIKSDVPGKGTRYRVRIGKFSSMQSAKATGDQLVANGTIQEFAVMAYEPPTTSVAVQRESKKPTDKLAANAKSASEPKKAAREVVEETTAKSEASRPPEELKEPVKESAQSTSDIPVAAAKTETSTENKIEGKLEAKSDPKTESALELKSKSSASSASKLETNSQAAVNNIPESEDKNEPDIAAPPVADALIESALAKTNWRMARKAAETDKNLRAIHFVDSMTGWAAGDAGAVYRTTDGGRSWKPLLSGVSANINFIYFLDWNHGWMIGEAIKGLGNNDDEGETVLLSTINGGRTWMIQKIPNLLSVHFTDLQNGWAVGRNATLLHTTNGGVDWKPAEQIQALVGLPVESSNYNFGFRDVYFLDPDHGWLVGNFYGRAQNNIGGLFVTSDGGKTWKRLPLTFETKYVSGRFTPGAITSVRFTDETTGTVTGEMKDGESRYFFALHTRDGGKTWQQHRTSIRSTLSTQFLDPVNGWMAAFAPREGSAEAVVYDSTLMRTDNGGMSWQTDFTAKGSRIRSLFFLSPQKGWAVGDRGMILRYEEKTKAMN